MTADLLRIVNECGFKKGMVSATNIGSAGAMVTIEFEPGLLQNFPENSTGR